MTKYLLFIFFIFTSCATNWSSLFEDEKDTKKRNDNLMKDFKVENDVFKKFETKEIKVVEKEVKTIIEKSVTAKTESKKELTRPEVVIPKKIKPIVNKRKYPSDYPEDYISLSKETKKTFENFSPVINVGEKTYMDINYLGVSTGKIVISTMPVTNISGAKAYHFHARLQTSRFYSYLYELDDRIDSFVSAETFVPLKFSLIQRESGKDVDDLQLFDHEKRKGFNFYKRVKKEKVKKRQGEFFIPEYFQDPLSLVAFIRGLDFEKQSEYFIPFFNKGVLRTFKVKSLGIEMVESNIGDKLAYKIRASSNYTGDTIKAGDMTFWFSKDSDKIFLQFKAKIKIGSVSGEIEKFEK